MATAQTASGGASVESVVRDCAATLEPVATYQLPPAVDGRLLWLPEGDTDRRWGTAEPLAQTFAEMAEGGGIDDEQWARFEAEQKHVDLADTQKTLSASKQLAGPRGA